MIEYIKHLNDTLWSFIYQFNFSDKIIVPLVIVSVLCVILLSFIKKNNIFLLFAVIAAMSVNYAVIRSPILSTKLHFALQTTASVIAGSDRYAKDFYAITNKKADSATDVVYVIYRLQDKEIKKELLNSTAGQLYLGYFNCEKRVTGILFLPLTMEFSIWIVLLFLLFIFRKKLIRNSPTLLVTILYGCLFTDDVTVGAVLFLLMTVCVRHIIKFLMEGGRWKKVKKRFVKKEDEYEEETGNINIYRTDFSTVNDSNLCR